MVGISALEDRGNKRCTTARSILGQKQVKLKVDPHQLRDSALHHVFEMWVESGIDQSYYIRHVHIGGLPEEGPVNGNDDILVVHLLEQGGDPGAGHHTSPSGDSLAHIPVVEQVVLEIFLVFQSNSIPESRAVIIGDLIRIHTQLLQSLPAPCVLPHRI